MGSAGVINLQGNLEEDIGGTGGASAGVNVMPGALLQSPGQRKIDHVFPSKVYAACYKSLAEPELSHTLQWDHDCRGTGQDQTGWVLSVLVRAREEKPMKK